MKYRLILVHYQPTLIKEYSFKVYMDFVQFKDFSAQAILTVNGIMEGKRSSAFQ